MGTSIATTLLVYRISNDSAVHRLESNARKRGEPVTLTELAAKYHPILDEENMAVLLTEIWEREQPEFWRAFRAGERPLPTRRVDPVDPALPFLGRNARYVSRTEPLSVQSLAAAEAYVRTNKAHLESVRNALRLRPSCRFAVSIPSGFAALMPHLPQLKAEAQSFRMVALIAVEHGVADEAIHALKDVEKIGKALANEPFLISQLVRVACYAIVIEDVERLVSRRSLSDTQLTELSALLKRLQMSGALKDSYIAERASSWSVFEMPDAMVAEINRSNDDSDDPGLDAAESRLGIQLINVTGIVSADRRFMLETMEEAVALAEKDTPESLTRIESLFDGIGDRAFRFPPKLISAMLLPSLSRAAQKFAALEARRRAGVTAIAVERYRLANGGRMPHLLDELVPLFLPQVPTDPFDGKPLRMRTLPTGFVIYSISADRTDNSGQERPRKGPLKGFDETFIVER